MKLLRVLCNTFQAGELSNEAYHSHEGISGTGLCKIYSSSVMSWLQTERKPSDALGIGIASHANFLEPELFATEFYRGFDESQYPDALRTQNDLKGFLGQHALKLTGSKKQQIERIIDFCQQSGERVEILDVLKAEYDEVNAGKTEVAPRDWAQLNGMRDRLLSDPAIAELIKGAKIEKSIICEVDFHSLLGRDEPNRGQHICTVKIRPDIVSRKFALVDYKTCLDCYGKFTKDIFNLNYDLKMALQHDILSLVYSRRPVVTLLAQNKLAPSEISNPFEYKPWLLGEGILDNGRKKYLTAIRRYCEYRQTGTPTGQGNDPEYADFPNWAVFTA